MSSDIQQNKGKCISTTDSIADVSIADLYPDLNTEQQAEAEYYLKRYISIIRRIFERLHRTKQPVDNSIEKY